MAIEGVSSTGTNIPPEVLPAEQEAAITPDSADVNRNTSDPTVRSPESTSESSDQTSTDQREQSLRAERENEVEFSNTDGDTATITRRGREASQISMNEPV
jgi:hypothetical protein